MRRIEPDLSNEELIFRLIRNWKGTRIAIDIGQHMTYERTAPGGTAWDQTAHVTGKFDELAFIDPKTSRLAVNKFVINLFSAGTPGESLIAREVRTMPEWALLTIGQIGLPFFENALEGMGLDAKLFLAYFKRFLPDAVRNQPHKTAQADTFRNHYTTQLITVTETYLGALTGDPLWRRLIAAFEKAGETLMPMRPNVDEILFRVPLGAFRKKALTLTDVVVKSELPPPPEILAKLKNIVDLYRKLRAIPDLSEFMEPLRMPLVVFQGTHLGRRFSLGPRTIGIGINVG